MKQSLIDLYEQMKEEYQYRPLKKGEKDETKEDMFQILTLLVVFLSILTLFFLILGREALVE